MVALLTKNFKNYLSSKQEAITDAVILVIIFIFMLTYFKPELLFLNTTTAGGDTATHNYPANYMHNYLLPNGKIIGWCPGWYAGIPLFQFYPPLSFILMHALTPFLTIEVAFKIATALGTFMLPACALIAMKLMDFKFPVPALAAVFTLPFLFMEANSMWGGNIPSTLAGEFSFSFSLAITLVFLGLLYRGVSGTKSSGRKRFVLHNSVIFAAVILSHIYTMLLAGLMSLFFLIKREKNEITRNFSYLFKTYGLAFMLTAFWLLPLVARLGYTTAYNYVWVINDWREVFPEILIPFYVFALITFVHASWKKDYRILYIAFSIFAAFILYLSAHEIGVVDIRLVPFIQFFPLLIAAYGIGRILEAIFIKAGSNRANKISAALRVSLPIIVALVVILWTENHVTYIDFWIKWNYEGFENKSLWNAYSDVNNFLRGTANDPRVVYEHSPLHDSAGSLRAYENLPLFSGRSTLEGLYMQSTPTSPFVFYIQSEISKVSSCPLPGYSCTSMNVTRAVPHLRMFNVKHIIARTDEVIQALYMDRNYGHVKSISPYEIFELQGEHSYVTVPKYEPVFFDTDDWRATAYEWFKSDNAIDVHLVFDKALKGKLQSVNNLNNLPREAVDSRCSIEEHIYNEEVRFNTTCVGKPHIIKISYYPGWHIEGAERVYLVSPSFMLVYPTQANVKLYYGKTVIDYVSETLSYLGILIILFAIFSRNHRIKSFFNL